MRLVRPVPASLIALVVVAVPGPACAQSPEIRDLEARVRILTGEVRRLKEQIVLPDSDRDLESFGGLGPAASKVYSKTSGISLGGYGEFFFQAPLGRDSAVRTADVFRFVTYTGYKFSDWIVMNAELEFEHATTSSNFAGRSGSVSVEFLYLDLLVDDAWNFRAGNLLAPVGFVNEMHEPPFYRGNVRPVVETEIIPSTWRELGAGMYGSLADGLSYKAYVLGGFDAKRFGDSGVRGGRQKGNRILWEDVMGILRLDYERSPVSVGASVAAGQADQNRPFDGAPISALVTIAEGHAEVREGRFQGRALVAVADIDDAGAISADLSASGDPVVVPSRQLGWYVEGAYDVSPWLPMPAGQELLAWARYEDYELQREVPSGLSPDPALDGSHVELGLEWKPDPSVVFKASVTIEDDGSGGSTDDPLRIGAGFVF